MRVFGVPKKGKAPQLYAASLLGTGRKSSHESERKIVCIPTDSMKSKKCSHTDNKKVPVRRRRESLSLPHYLTQRSTAACNHRR